ncbi:MAG: class I SAM-dependent methyltransferase [Betaproteobacteria bacterium]
MAKTKFHFIDDYRRLVRELMAQFPIDEAMSRAVGGNYEAFGEIEKQALIGYGLETHHTLVDVGCGSGRLAQALIPYLKTGRVLATDVVPEFLDYAKEGCPATWQFAEVDDVRIPFPDDCADFACFFSVFTHLLHEESYCYLLEAQRVVKPGGVVVFSFLEFEDNWQTFENTYKNIRDGRDNDHLNTFIGRDVIKAWAAHTDLTVIEVRGAHDPFVELSRPIDFDDGHRAQKRSAMGQSVCAMRNSKPASAASPSSAWGKTGSYRVSYGSE